MDIPEPLQLPQAEQATHSGIEETFTESLLKCMLQLHGHP